MKKTFLTGLAALLINCETNTFPALQTPSEQVSPQESVYRSIKIEGPEEYKQNIVQALEMIYAKDPRNWYVVRRNINLIRLHPPSGMNVDAGIYNTDDNKSTPWKYQPLEWVAGEIVHDAWHREYYRRDETYDGREGERKCMERQNEFFSKVGYPPLNIETYLQTRYWEIKRNW